MPREIDLSASDLDHSITRQLRDHVRSLDPQPALDRREACFKFTIVEPGKVWLTEFPGPRAASNNDPAQEFGPLELPPAITDQLKPGWLAFLEIGRAKGGWRMLAVEAIYVPERDVAKSRKAKAASRKPHAGQAGDSIEPLDKPPAKAASATRAPAWKFTSTLRARAFGRRSSALAGKRLTEAVAEIKQTAKLDAQRAADGAVLLFSKIEPAFEQIDSSSGALGTAVNKAIRDLPRSLRPAAQTRPPTANAWRSSSRPSRMTGWATSTAWATVGASCAGPGCWRRNGPTG